MPCFLSHVLHNAAFCSVDTAGPGRGRGQDVADMVTSIPQSSRVVPPLKTWSQPHNQEQNYIPSKVCNNAVDLLDGIPPHASLPKLYNLVPMSWPKLSGSAGLLQQRARGARAQWGHVLACMIGCHELTVVQDWAPPWLGKVACFACALICSALLGPFPSLTHVHSCASA